MSAPACGYLTSRYPSITHTFVRAEVEGLREAGVRVATASVRRVSEDELLADAERAEFRSTHALLPVSPLRLARCHGVALARHPAAYLRTMVGALRLAHAGGRPRLWQLFYFAEAILLWHWAREHDLRHMRVHHANVASDVTMLACRFGNAAGADPAWTWSLTIHGPTELLDLGPHKLGDKVADAAAVICTSDFVRSQVASLLDPAEMGKVHTVHCGVDLREFSLPAGGAAARAQDEILCVAALSRRKGVAVLLEALALLHERGVGPRLRLIGDGPERQALKAQAAALGIADAVEFAGALGNDVVARACARAAVFCLPSFAEGVPTVLIEAMAMECPVVTTRIMGVPELVEDGVSGLLVTPHRADQLADALAALLADPERREAMGRAGRAKVEHDFALHTQAQVLLTRLRPLMGG